MVTIFNIYNLPRVYVLFALVTGSLIAITFSGLTNHLFDADGYEWMIEMEHAQNGYAYLFSSERTLPIRPLPDFIVYVGYYIWGANATAYHILHISLHFLTGLLLLYTFKAFEVDLELSLCATLLFLFNVTHFRTLYWFANISYVLAVMCALCALINFNSFLKVRQYYSLFLSVGALVLAITCHPSTVSLAPFCTYLAWRRQDTFVKSITDTWLIWFLGIVGVIAVYLASPWTTQIHGAGSKPEIDLLVKNLLWFTSRLVTIAHWFLITPNDTVGPVDYIFGLLVCISFTFLLFHNSGPVGIWAALAMVAVMPFLNHPPPEQRWFPVGPSRQLYLSTIGSSFVFAFFIRKIANFVGQYRWQKQGIFAICIVALIVSSYYTLQKSEALSYYTSGRSYIARGDNYNGHILLQRAFLTQADLVPFDGYLRLATASSGQGIPQTSIFQTGLALYPNHPQLLLLEGLSYYLSDEEWPSQKASLIIQNAFSLGVDREQLRKDASLVLQNMAGYYHLNGAYKKATFLYEQALIYRPDYSVALFNLANALYKDGNRDEMVNTLHRLLEVDSENFKALQLLGNVLFEEGRYEDAKQIYLQFVEVSQTDANVYYKLALSLKKLGQFTDAVQAFQKGLEIAPDAVDMRLKFADCLYEMGNTKDCVREYEQVFSRDPTNVIVLKQLVSLLLELQRVSDAETWIKKALSLDSRQAEFWYLLAHVQQAKGDLLALQDALKSALRLAPDQVTYQEAYLNLGGVFQLQSNMNVARDIYMYLVEIMPGDVRVHLNLGILNYSEARYSEAVENFSHAVTLIPEDVEAQLGLAQAYEMVDRLEEAQLVYRKILILDAENAIAREQLQILQAKN